MTEAELRRYAAVILEVGVALQPGQDVLIDGSLDHAPFARLLADEAYARGAAYVDVWYWDAHTKAARLRHAPTDTLTRVPAWLDARYRALGESHGVLINLVGDAAPGLLDDLDPHRTGLDRMPRLASRMEIQTSNAVQWAFAAVPTDGWAERVLGRPDRDALWAHLRAVMRLGADDPVAVWRARMDELHARCAALDAERFDALHLVGPGTDLTLGLPAGHCWATAELTTQTGVRHVACLPTEEVFTTPDPARTEGHVTASKPLALAGSLIEDLRLEFRSGRAVDVRATRGAEVVRAQMAIDEGAARLGEVALVDDSSPLQQLGVLFYETLLDESAASHIAWGSGLPDGHRDYDPRRPETRDALPINRSALHTDFMIGGPDLAVTGVRADRSRSPILEGERWVLSG